MRHPALHATVAAALLLVAPRAAVQEQSQKKLLTLEQVSGRAAEAQRVDFSPTLTRWSWAPDGVHLVRGRGEEARWVDPRTFKEAEPPAADDPDEARREALAGALEALRGIDAKRAARLASGSAQESEDGAARLIDAGEDGLIFVREGSGARRLDLGGDGSHELADLSPDGRHLAFVRGGDLLLVETGDGRLRAVTDDGDEEHLNGKLDWVYQEEVYGRGGFKAFWWSPDSRHVAFLALDESPVHAFTVVDHIEPDTFRVKAEVADYPKAGDPNPLTRLAIASTGGAVTWVDLSQYDEEFLVVRVGWTPDGSGCVFVVQDRIQSWADLNTADPATGEVRTLIHEGSDSWVDRPSPPQWLADGSFLWLSARTGWSHLYHYRPDGTLIRPVTQGEWAVRRTRRRGPSAIDVDEEAGLLWFQSTEGGAINANTHRIGLDGTGLVRLTRGDGQHSVRFNGDRSLFLDSVSSLADPGEVRLCSGQGELLKVLSRAAVPDAETYLTGEWELHEVPARDGFPLDVALLKPVPFDPGTSHPVWIPTYSGPGAPSVRNRWNSSGWYRFLAQRGVIVMQVNVRTASGKGHWTTAQGYKQFGVLEVRDMIDVVDWLTAQPWADGERVGITGGSYGGFMTAYSMLTSDRFALGIAGSGVYDWGMYDSIYTERYMSTPQLNPEGYAKTSCVENAGGLHGHLFLYHGLMDDNVHVQNMFQLAYALQRAGKDFGLMVYPQQRHGIRQRELRWHLRRKEWSLLQQVLGAREAPGRPAVTPAAAAFDSSGG